MEYLKDKIFPEVFKTLLNFLSGFLLLYFGSVLKKSSENNSSSLFSFDFSPALSIVLYAIYFSLLLYFVWKGIKSIRAMFFSYIDHLQDEYVPPKFDLTGFDDPFQYFDYRHNRAYESFIFRLHYIQLNDLDFIPDPLLDISNPKCSDENCVTDLIMKRSYFGFYKYTCPACKKKYSSKYNQSTLKSNLKMVIFAEHERKEDELPF